MPPGRVSLRPAGARARGSAESAKAGAREEDEVFSGRARRPPSPLDARRGAPRERARVQLPRGRGPDVGVRATPTEEGSAEQRDSTRDSAALGGPPRLRACARGLWPSSQPCWCCPGVHGGRGHCTSQCTLQRRPTARLASVGLSTPRGRSLVRGANHPLACFGRVRRMLRRRRSESSFASLRKKASRRSRLRPRGRRQRQRLRLPVPTTRWSQSSRRRLRLAVPTTRWVLPALPTTRWHHLWNPPRMTRTPRGLLRG